MSDAYLLTAVGRTPWIQPGWCPQRESPGAEGVGAATPFTWPTCRGPVARPRRFPVQEAGHPRDGKREARPVAGPGGYLGCGSVLLQGLGQALRVSEGPDDTRLLMWPPGGLLPQILFYGRSFVMSSLHKSPIR